MFDDKFPRLLRAKVQAILVHEHLHVLKPHAPPFFGDIFIVELLQTKVLSKLRELVRFSPDLEGSLPDLIPSVREKGLEGLVAKRLSFANSLS
jgi:hypothetical protein